MGKVDFRDYKTFLYGFGLLFILIVWLFMFSEGLSVHSLVKFVMLIILSYLAMVYDITTKRIPNWLVLVMAAGWVLIVIPVLFHNIENGTRIIVDSISGVLIGGGMFLLVYFISRKNLGGGDIKFMAAAGLYLGFSGTIPVMLYGSILAAGTGMVLIMFKVIKRKDPIPLAPFLFIGIIITLFTV